MPPLKDPVLARALLTVAGGETIPDDFGEYDSDNFVEPAIVTAIKWGRIWGFALFAILAVLPIVSLPRRRPSTLGLPIPSSRIAPSMTRD